MKNFTPNSNQQQHFSFGYIRGSEIRERKRDLSRELTAFQVPIELSQTVFLLVSIQSSRTHTVTTSTTSNTGRDSCHFLLFSTLGLEGKTKRKVLRHRDQFSYRNWWAFAGWRWHGSKENLLIVNYVASLIFLPLFVSAISRVQVFDAVG